MAEFEHYALYVVVGIVTFSHILHQLDLQLGWPPFLVKILQKRRRREVAEVLMALGVPFDTKEEVRAAIRTRHVARYSDPRERCLKLLRTCTRTQGTHLVGSVHAQPFPYFVDVMSECLTRDKSDECIHILTSYLQAEKVALDDMDYIVGIKAGSPTIAISLAEKINKPILLFRGREQYKFNAHDKDPALLFDGNLGSGKRAVIVDDSTTGGRKAIDCIEALRRAGVTVKEFWVLFEPLGKDARGLLKNQGVTLRSVVKMDETTIAVLSKPQE